MNVFEDAGYFCVDNLPAGMIRSLAELFLHEGSKVERACVVSDLRAGDYFEVLVRGARRARRRPRRHHARAVPGGRRGHSCSPATRRPAGAIRRPATATSPTASGASATLLAPIRERADTVIDTTGLSASALRRKVASEMLAPAEPGKLAVTFGSFGHKHGPARDADLVLDVRFLPNPHWEPELRPLTGFDRRIVEYVGRDGRLKEFYDRVLPLLEYLLPQYVAEGKSHLVVAIGCTGGRHRSVVIAEDLAAHFRDDGRYFVEVQHRDVDRAPGARRVDTLPGPPPLRLRSRKGFASPCQYASGSTASAASAATSSAPRTSPAPTSRSSPSTTSPTTRRSRTCSSTTRSTGRSRARSRSATAR